VVTRRVPVVDGLGRARLFPLADTSCAAQLFHDGQALLYDAYTLVMILPGRTDRTAVRVLMRGIEPDAEGARRATAAVNALYASGRWGFDDLPGPERQPGWSPSVDEGYASYHWPAE